nr:protease pro-enzyme activation domain-containing protein [Pullulanibacillus pueri]
MSVVVGGTLILGSLPITASAKEPTTQVIPQGTGSAVLDQANYFDDVDPSTKVTVDIVMKVQNQAELQRYINSTVTPGSRNYHKYLNVSQFKAKYAPNPSEVNRVTRYLKSFGIQSQVYKDNLVITATGTVAQFNKAFSIELKHAKFHGKSFRATKKSPRAPKDVAQNILAILGLSDYSSFTTNIAKRPVDIKESAEQGPLNLDPSDLIEHYHLQPLYDKGATGKGQTIGIVTLADFNPEDAYSFWKQEGIETKPHRIKVNEVDGGSGYDGYDETTLDVEQSGALAPDANINVYVGPNTDPGFVDAFAQAINENKAQQLSVSWGLSEPTIDYYVDQQMESPEYAEVFNELFMQAAAQGISMFAAAGDAGAYDATRSLGTYQLSVDNPADSPYITAAGGTTLPWEVTTSSGVKVQVNHERAWGWDYLYPFFDSLGLNTPSGWLANYFVGGGGGFSTQFDTPDYQKGVRGVNTYTGVKQWQANADFSSVEKIEPEIVKGKGSGRNLPDLSMNADPYSGYKIYTSDPGNPGSNGEMSAIGGTSIVAPQLSGISALINSDNHNRVGFWNPQIYRFAQEKDSPFDPLNATGSANDNLFYTGTKGTIYNQATGLGIPDVAALAKKFARY